MTNPWAPYAPSKDAPWNLRRVVHLHRRAGFAATWGEIQRDLKDGPQQSIGRVLNGKAASEGVPEKFAETANLLGDTAASSRDPARLKAWWVYRMMFSPDPLTERLVVMWHNHFATSNFKVQDLTAMRQQNERFRALSRQRFGEILNGRGPRAGATGLDGRAGESQGASKRKPGPRADGAVHSRHRPLQRKRCEGGGSGPDRLDR